MIKGKYYCIFLLQFLSHSAEAEVRLVLSAALTDSYFEFRKRQYIESFSILSKHGYSNPYIIEALKKRGETFLDSYSQHVYYAQTNNPLLRNKGINEAKTMLEGLKYFNFAPDDIILKLTGRYHFKSDYFLKLVQNNQHLDAIVRFAPDGQQDTCCFAMKNKHLQRMFESLDYIAMEDHMINLEYAVAQYVQQRMRTGEFKVLVVDKLDLQANYYASSTNPGAEGIVNF